MDFGELAKVFGTFFAIMNPFVNLPIFLAMTAGLTVAQQRFLAIKVTSFSAIMCLVILLAGQTIIGFFGITVDQFRIAGGAVLAHIAWSMLNGQDSASHHGSEQEKDSMQDLTSLAFYPLTFPLIVGPGTMATLIIYAGQEPDSGRLIALALVVAVILVILLAVFFYAAAIGEMLSDTMRVIATRLMGMILLAIAIGMLIDGITAVLPALAATG